MKTITLTTKIKLLPTPDEKNLLRETMKRYSKACDFVSDWAFANRTVDRDEIHNATYSDVRSRFGLGSQMAESVMRTVIARYKTIRQNQPKKSQNWEIEPVFKSFQCDEV